MVRTPKSKPRALPPGPPLRSVVAMQYRTIRFVTAGDGSRVDRLVADRSGAGRRGVRGWFAAGLVRIDGRLAAASEVPGPGSVVTVEPPAGSRTEGPRLPVRVLVEDGEHVVVSKPAGMHCEKGHTPGSLAEWLEARYGDLSAVGDRPEEGGLVHRLDHDTSGVVVAALGRAAYRRLRDAFGRGATRKSYLALVEGRVRAPLDVHFPLARRGARMAVAGPRDEAIGARTVLEPMAGGPGWSLVLATMSSGAMHQVRVHAAAADHPLFGDALYGGRPLEGCRREGQLLHALRIEVDDGPDVTAAPAEDFVEAYARLVRRGT